MLTLYEPKLRDLWFRQQMLADEDTMSFNRAWGGTIRFPEERWADWYDNWVRNRDGSRYYRFLKDRDNRFVGEIAYHADPDTGRIMASVIVFARYRGKGYGREALDLLCLAAKRNGVGALYDEIAAGNPAVRLFLQQGFSEEYRTEETIVLKKDLTV